MTLASVIGVIIIFQLTLNYLILAGGNYKKSLNVWFAAMNSSIMSWIFTILLANVQFSNYDISLFVNRLSFASIFLFTYFLYNFSRNFSLVKLKMPKVVDYYFSFSTSVWIFLTILTDTVVKGLIRVEDRYDVDRSGALYIVFLAFILLHLLLSIGVLFLKFFKAKQTEKAKLRTILLGLMVVSFLVVMTNAIIPSITGTTVSSDYGPLAIILWLFSIFYTIRVHRFLDVRLVIGRMVYYMVVGIIFLVGYYGVYFMDKGFFGSSEEIGAVVTGPLNSIVFAVVFIKLNDYIRLQVRSRIINPGYDPLEVTDKLSRQTARLLDIREITKTAMESLAQTIRADYEAFIIVSEQGKKRKFINETDKIRKDLDVANFVPLITVWDDIGRVPIVLDELEVEFPETFRKHMSILRDLLAYMKKHNIKVIVPLKETEENIGMLLLGRKEGDSFYTIQDIEFIQGIATAVGLAVTRSLYFLEVQELNKHLQKKVDEATSDLMTKNEKLRDAIRKIEEIRRQERDMIDVMGHELRTPITIVRNALLVLESKMKKKEKISEAKVLDYVEKAIESARREVNLVETLLSATKVESHRIQLLLTKIDVKDVVEDGIESQKNFAAEKAIKINFDKPKTMVWGYADRTRIQEVMDNLLSNAIKYTLRGEVNISIKTVKNDVYISVQDTGMGIHKEDIANLGKKFFRARQYIKSEKGQTSGVVRPGGTGLGLYVSFNLVELMGGKIKIDSELGKGSTFTFNVPLFKGQADKHIDQTFE